MILFEVPLGSLCRDQCQADVPSFLADDTFASAIIWGAHDASRALSRDRAHACTSPSTHALAWSESLTGLGNSPAFAFR